MRATRDKGVFRDEGLGGEKGAEAWRREGEEEAEEDEMIIEGRRRCRRGGRREREEDKDGVGKGKGRRGRGRREEEARAWQEFNGRRAVGREPRGKRVGRGKG